MTATAIFLCVLISSVLSSAVPKLQNITITVPAGTTNHGNPSLLCFPANVWDIIFFFLGNYVAHIATKIPPPGEAPINALTSRLSILFLPFSGIPAAVWCIYHAAQLQKTPLQIALKSSALCEVIRAQWWRPEDGDIVRNLKVSQNVEELFSTSINISNSRTLCETNGQIGESKPEGQEYRPPILRAEIKLSPGVETIEQSDKWYRGGRQIYGICKVPEGYSLATFPTHSKVKRCPFPGADLSATNSPDILYTSRTTENQSELSGSYNIVKPIIAMVQLFYGCLTLYRARGDQVKQYGYAAFGLTVIPYVTMSFINLCGALLTPSYSRMYLVSTMIMKEAQKRIGADFWGIVGTADVAENSDLNDDSSCPGTFTGVFEVKDDREYRLRLYRPSSHLQKVERCENNDPENQCDIQNDNSSQNFAIVIFPGQDVQSMDDESAPLPTLEIPACERPEQSRKKKVRESIIHLVMIIIGCIPIAVVGGLSHFEPGNSSTSQRGWIMAWFTAGIGSGLFDLQEIWTGSTLILGQVAYSGVFLYSILIVILMVLGSIVASGIGGFIVVGKMIHEYGSCTRLF